MLAQSSAENHEISVQLGNGVGTVAASAMTTIFYLVHDLNDAAVNKRVRMLQTGGARVILAGFWRGPDPGPNVDCAEMYRLGQTHDSRLLQRALAVLKTSAMPGVLRAAATQCEVIIARNLEMLLLANRIRRSGQRVVYECLDIHRMMLGAGPLSIALRVLERSLMRASALLITSSPAFLRCYFEPVQRIQTPSYVVENKLFASAVETDFTKRQSLAQGPWTIGWFGNLRCRRTLSELLEIAEAANGQVRIVIGGRPSLAQFPNFGTLIKSPHVNFVGPYSTIQLPHLYASCHFAWCLDYFEDGLNSEWLLPNRMYEAMAAGVVPVARSETETARWLSQYDAGIVLPRQGAAEALVMILRDLSFDDFIRLTRVVDQVPRDAVRVSEAYCEELVAAIGS